MNGLFGSEALEVGIGLALFFLLISLICTAAREAIEGMMKTRALDLERALRELLGDADGRGVTKSMFGHPMISGLFGGVYDPERLRLSRNWTGVGRQMHMPLQARRNLPSYIPANQFATALIDLVARGPSTPEPSSTATGVIAPTAPLNMTSLRQAAAAFPNSNVQRVIVTGLDAAGDDLEKLKAHLEGWFDGTMDRASGWYKRRTQTMLFWMGLIAAVLLNLDALTVLDRLGTDGKLRATAVAAAEARAQSRAPAGARNTGAGSVKDQVAAVRSELEGIGYPIGWKGGLPGPQMKPVAGWASDQPCGGWFKRSDGQGGCNVLRRPLLIPVGWLITALAVMLGAPFWFDILNKVMIVRATVKPREKSPDEPSPESRKAAAPAASTPTAAQEHDQKQT